MFCKAFSRTLNWKYHAKINISRLSEVIALFFQPSEYIAVIVVGIDHSDEAPQSLSPACKPADLPTC